MTSMMCQPTELRTGGPSSPIFWVKAAFSNSGSSAPRPKKPRSPPERPDASSETSAATLANFSPLAMRERAAAARSRAFLSAMLSGDAGT